MHKKINSFLTQFGNKFIGATKKKIKEPLLEANDSSLFRESSLKTIIPLTTGTGVNLEALHKDAVKGSNVSSALSQID